MPRFNAHASPGITLRLFWTAAVLGALPMAIHGYLILFRGSRLI